MAYALAYVHLRFGGQSTVLRAHGKLAGKMDAFRWILPAFSMILGLGVTRVLSGLVEVFRSRHRAKLDWIPVVWAIVVFAVQLQLWWAVIELAHVVKVWTPLSFLLLISLPLLLFIAAALILPAQKLEEGSSIRDSFMEDGRWGLGALSLYMLFAIVADWHFWRVPLWSVEGVLNLVLAVLPLGLLMSRSRGVEVGVTIASVVMFIVTTIYITPGAYD